MDVVVTGRNVEVPEHFRVHVSDKMAGVERYDGKVIRYEVELYHEKNPRLSKVCQRVEITGKGGGSPVRAEASGPDFHATRLRDGQARRTTAASPRPRQGSPRSAPAHLRSRGHCAPSPPYSATNRVSDSTTQPSIPDRMTISTRSPGTWTVPGQIVREKEHSGEPMTVNEALDELELLGHDFYLFVDASCGRPCVIYRRKGFDYGIIRLTETAPNNR